MRKNEAPMSIIKSLMVGDSHDFSLSRMAVIRSMCYNIGLQWDKKFTTKVDRETKTIKVTRVK